MALVELLKGAPHGEPLPVGLEGLLQVPHVVVHHRQKERCALTAGISCPLLDQHRQIKLQAGDQS